MERGAEAIDRRGGVCARCFGLRGGPAPGCGRRADLSVAERASEHRRTICRGGRRGGAERAIADGCAGGGDRAWPGHSRAHCGVGAHRADDRGDQSVGGAMIPLPTGVRVWIATGHTDMRCGMQSLALLVQEAFKRDPHAGDLYVFRGRSGSLIKIFGTTGSACRSTPSGWSAAGLFGRRPLPASSRSQLRSSPTCSITFIDTPGFHDDPPVRSTASMRCSRNWRMASRAGLVSGKR